MPFCSFVDDGALEFYEKSAHEYEMWTEKEHHARLLILAQIFTDNPDRTHCHVCEKVKKGKKKGKTIKKLETIEKLEVCEWIELRPQVFEAGDWYAKNEPKYTFAKVRSLLYTWSAELLFGRRLGKGNRKTLPVCVELGIKMAFRSSSAEDPEKFVGFKHANATIDEKTATVACKPEFLAESSGSTYTGVSQATLETNFTINEDPMSYQRKLLFEFEYVEEMKKEKGTKKKEPQDSLQHLEEYNWGDFHSPDKVESNTVCTITETDESEKKTDGKRKQVFTKESRIEKEQQMLDEYAQRAKRIQCTLDNLANDIEPANKDKGAEGMVLVTIETTEETKKTTKETKKYFCPESDA